MSKRTEEVVKSLRVFRKWHRWIGTVIAVLVILSAVTGLLLSYKKQFDYLQPGTQKGKTTDSGHWLSLDSLMALSENYIIEQGLDHGDLSIDRIDVRPDKGIAKIRYEQDWEIQMDLESGAVYSYAKRNADWIERIHDGSIISEGFKLVSMNVLSIGLLIMVGSGLWLWYGPKKIRIMKRSEKL